MTLRVMEGSSERWEHDSPDNRRPGIWYGVSHVVATNVYLDDMNISKRSNGGVAQNNGVVVPLLYDLERVEVLRGPQGTLFGRNASAGLIHIISRRPNMNEVEGFDRKDYPLHQAAVARDPEGPEIRLGLAPEVPPSAGAAVAAACGAAISGSRVTVVSAPTSSAMRSA